MDIKISVKNKTALGDGTEIVCGNSDYRVVFELDAEWDEYELRTMRVDYRDGGFEDVDFAGNICALPVVRNRNRIAIGIYAGALRTSTPALFRCVKCITDADTIILPDASPLRPLTVKLGSATVVYDGSSEKLIDIADGSEVAY